MSAKYLTPFGFLALVPLGCWLGGPWTFAATVATLVCMPVLDPVLGRIEQHGRAADALTRWLPRIYVAAQLAVAAWIMVAVSRSGTRPLEAIGLAISTGITTGIFGMVATHELIHSHHRHDRQLGALLLATALYMHFDIAHLCGHHRKAATDDDPVSARLREGFYAFLLRSVVGQLRESWRHETERLRRLKPAARLLRNRLVVDFSIEALMLIAVAILSWRALAFLVTTAIIAVALLEGFNYVAHYGLRRQVGPDGRLQHLEARHSWNSKSRMDSAALFNMGCHSDHHRRPARPFQQLASVKGEAELPFGYAAAIMIALVPPVWRHVMDGRAIAATRV